MDEKQRTTLTLAERLLELAEHSSEVEMRCSLSRIYYAVYHVAKTLTGETNHGKISIALSRQEEGLGERYKWLRELRSGADYNPAFVKQQYGDLGSFKIRFPQEMGNARSLYERLMQLTGESNGR